MTSLDSDAATSPLPGPVPYPVVVLEQKQDPASVALPEGHGAIVIDAWRPVASAMERSRALPAKLLVNRQVVSRQWGRIHVTVPPGSHSILASEATPHACQRVMVGAGEVIHLDYIRSYTLAGARSGRLVPPGTRPAGFPLTIAWCAFTHALAIGFGAFFVLLLAVGLLRLPLSIVYLLSVIVAVLDLARTLAWPQGFGRRLRHPAVQALREQTARALADAATGPAGARFLGDHPPKHGPTPPPGHAAIRLHATRTDGAGPIDLISPAAYREPPRVVEQNPALQINGRDLPADWSIWWYPVPAGRATIRVTHPVTAELEINTPAGQVVDAYYWAVPALDITRDQTFTAGPQPIIPAFSAALITTIPQREPPPPAWRTDPKLLSPLQIEVLRTGKFNRKKFERERLASGGTTPTGPRLTVRTAIQHRSRNRQAGAPDDQTQP